MGAKVQSRDKPTIAKVRLRTTIQAYFDDSIRPNQELAADYIKIIGL